LHFALCTYPLRRSLCTSFELLSGPRASLLWCSRTFLLKMHYGIKIGNNRGMGSSDFDPNENILIFLASNLCKISSKSNKNCDHTSADRQTDREKDASDFIICPILCCSNGPDNNYKLALMNSKSVR